MYDDLKISEACRNTEWPNSQMLFEMEPADFASAIIKIDAKALREHMLYAHAMLKKLQEQLEDLSYNLAEYEKHGSGLRP